MADVYCFSGSGHSMRVASFFKERLNGTVIPIGKNTEQGASETAIVVFPIYCQNIPSPVTAFLKQLNAKYAILVALYGGISYGNVLYEAQSLYNGIVIAGAYVPSGHSYKNEPFVFDVNRLEPLLNKLSSREKVDIPKMPKNIFSDLAPALRSRIGVSLRRSEDCDGCDVCGKTCPVGAMKKGIADRSCIRCLRCVSVCPKNALSFKPILAMRIYLGFRRKNEFKLYI